MYQNKALSILSKVGAETLEEAMDIIWNDHANGWPIAPQYREAYNYMATKLGEPPLEEAAPAPAQPEYGEEEIPL